MWIQNEEEPDVDGESEDCIFQETGQREECSGGGEGE